MLNLCCRAAFCCHFSISSSSRASAVPSVVSELYHLSPSMHSLPVCLPRGSTCVPCGARAVLCALWRQRGSTCVPCGARTGLRALWRQRPVCICCGCSVGYAEAGFSAFSDGRSVCLFSLRRSSLFFQGVPCLCMHTLHVPVQGQDALPVFFLQHIDDLECPPPPQG